MCTPRSFLLFVCSMQMLTIIERQIFDFLGYMFAPILANFLHIVFIIFGIFGAYQFRGKYVTSYSLWIIIWIGWNIFLLCFYLNISPFDRNSDLINMGTGSVSWFETHGYGCKPVFLTNVTLEDPFRPIRPDHVDDCFLDYWIIECIHSSIQIFLALLGLIGAICIACVLWNDDDSFEFMGNDIKSPVHKSLHPMYVSYSSIPTGSTSKINFKNNDSNQFGIVLTSVHNSKKNTNSLSPNYMNNHSNSNTQSSITNKSKWIQSPEHFKLIDHQQIGSASNLNKYESENNLLSKSASTQQIMKRNPSFNNFKDVDTDSMKSYLMPLSEVSTALASPITTNKLMATNLQQQKLISKSFGIQNPLNKLLYDNDDGTKSIKVQDHNEQNSQKDKKNNSPTVRSDYNLKNTKNQIDHFLKTSSPSHQIQSSDQFVSTTHSPNLNHMPRRRPIPSFPQEEMSQMPITFESSNTSYVASNRANGANFCDQIRHVPMPTRYNLNQFIPEYNIRNPLPPLPPHIFHHPMYRVRSQDRIGNRFKRQSGAQVVISLRENQRPRSFCNNAINYKDYNDFRQNIDKE